MWCEGSLFWNAVSPLTDPPTGGHSGGAWHDLPVLVFLVFRWWSTHKRAPTRAVDAKGTASVALTPPIQAISIHPFITSVKSTGLPGVASERDSRTAPIRFLMGPLLFFARSSSTHPGPRSSIIQTGRPSNVVGTWKRVVLMAMSYGTTTRTTICITIITVISRSHPKENI